MWIRKVLIEKIIGCLKIQNTGRYLVYQISRSEYCLSPKKLKNMDNEHNGSDDFKNMYVFSFSYAILLRGVYTRILVNNAMFLKVFPKNDFKIFTVIINFKYLYSGMKLGLDHSIESFENGFYFGFFFY